MSVNHQAIPQTDDVVSDDDLLRDVQKFWNEHIHDWKVAKSPAGTKEFFQEIEDYRFEKLHYLPELVDFNGYTGKQLLDVGCGVGNDLSRFSRGGAQVYGISSLSLALAPSIE